MTDEIFYTLEHDGELFDLECTKPEEVATWADDWWAEKHQDEEMRNGETREDDSYIVKYSVDDDGETTELSREGYGLYYEYYHGDLKEHGTWGL